MRNPPKSTHFNKILEDSGSKIDILGSKMAKIDENSGLFENFQRLLGENMKIWVPGTEN